MNATLVNPSSISGKRNLYLWYCASGHRNGPSDITCHQCSLKRIERHALVHASERTVIYRGPQGQVSIPGRADEPMNPKLAADGYVREEIESATGLNALEKQGYVHVATNFNEGICPPTVEPDIPEPKSAKELGLLD